MKKIIVSFLIIVIFTLSVVHAEQPRRFALKSAHIVYELTGNVSGEKKVWFDDYGMKFFEETNETTTIKMMGITSEQIEHKITIHDGQIIYDIDMIAKTGYKGTLPSLETLQDMAEDMTEAEQKQLADDIMNSLDGQKLGTEIFLGKSCEVMEVMGIKSWIYNGITLKSEANIMGIVSNVTVTKFEENIKVPASRFEPPQGITYEDMPSFGSMFSDEEYNDEEYEDEEDTDVPVPITFDEFKNGLSGISDARYTQTMVMEEDGQYMAMYMSGMGSMIMITGSGYSSEEFESGFETFIHKGKTMKYGNIAEGGNSISLLIVLYPAQKLMILINSLSEMAKDDLIDIADKLEF
jgi:hypothetical protein